MRTIIFVLLLGAQVSYAETTDNSIRCKSRDGKTELSIEVGENQTASVVSFKNRGKTLVSNLNATAIDGKTKLVISGSGFTFVGEQGFATAEVAYLDDAHTVFKTNIFCQYPKVSTVEFDENL